MEVQSDQELTNSDIYDSCGGNETIQNDFLDIDETGSEDESEFSDATSSPEKVLKSSENGKELFDDGKTLDIEAHKSKRVSEACDYDIHSKQLKECKVDASKITKNEIFEDISDLEKKALLGNFEDKLNVGYAVEALDAKELFSGDVPNGIDKSISKQDSPPSNKKKRSEILQALKCNDTDLLKKAAIYESGLLSDKIRKEAWPKLVGLINHLNETPLPTTEEIKAHPYYGQVVLDVNRSLKRFPPSIKEAQRLTMLDQLVVLIMRVLCKNPEMHYYQGYHDICVTFLLVLGEETAFHVLEKLSVTHFKVFMEKNMEPTIHLLEHMYALIGRRSPQLKKFLLRSEVGIAYCLSWLITWFGHVLNNYDDVVRLFDFFIVSDPWMPMYLTAAVVLHREAGVMKQDCDMASVHSYLSDIPDNLPFEKLILDAISLMKNYPPKLLDKENPYIPKNALRPKGRWNFISSIIRRIKSFVPASNITLPIAVAVGVLLASYLYQAYKQ